MIIELVLVTAVVGGLLTWLFVERRPQNFPPGPIGFPVVGHLPRLGPKAHETLLKWKKLYGPVIGVWFGSWRTVVFNDSKSIREAMSMNAFAGRPKLSLFTVRSNGVPKGIMFTEGHQWMEQRKFALKHLRDFGFGMNSMEGKIHDEIVELVERLKSTSEISTQVKHMFHGPVISALWNILFGERMDLNDKEILQAIPALTSLFSDTDFVASLSILLPWLNEISPKISGLEKIMNNMTPLKMFMQKQIDKHYQSYTPDQPRDFVDAYTDEVRKTKDIGSSFHEGHGEMLYSLLDIFLAGADTASTTLSWTLAYLIHHPDVQKKLQNEIDEKIGSERLPSLADRSSMCYTEAVINEVLRYSTLTQFAAFHSTTQDTQFRGYFIPKDTMIITNLYAAHFDEEVWDNPHSFCPERFLDSKGKFQKNENLIPFSSGKRVCIGESLARIELFLFITSLFQTFTVSAAEKLPSLKPVVGLTLSPAPFKVLFHIR